MSAQRLCHTRKGSDPRVKAFCSVCRLQAAGMREQPLPPARGALQASSVLDARWRPQERRALHLTYKMRFLLKHLSRSVVFVDDQLNK